MRGGVFLAAMLAVWGAYAGSGHAATATATAPSINCRLPETPEACALREAPPARVAAYCNKTVMPQVCADIVRTKLLAYAGEWMSDRWRRSAEAAQAERAALAASRQRKPSMLDRSAVDEAAATYAASSGRVSWSSETYPVGQEHLDALEPPDWRPPSDPLDIMQYGKLSGWMTTRDDEPKRKRMPLSARPAGVAPPPTGEVPASVYGTKPPSSEIQKTLIEVERRYQLVPGLLEAVCRTESDLRPGVISWRGRVNRNAQTPQDGVNIVNDMLSNNMNDPDAGICQRNVKHHPKASIFPNETMHDWFDYRHGIEWAGWYLGRILVWGGDEWSGNRVKGTGGDVAKAVMMYNAWLNTSAGASYLNKVWKKWADVRKQRGISEQVAKEFLAVSPFGARFLNLEQHMLTQLTAGR